MSDPVYLDDQGNPVAAPEGARALEPSHGAPQITEAEWAALPAGQKAQRLLRSFGGNLLAGALPGSGDALDHPVATAASMLIPDGAVASKAVKGAGSVAYKAGAALLPRTLKQQYPNIAETGIREGIALTKRGAAEAGARVGQSAQQADNLIATAERSGAGPASPRRVVRELRPVADRMRSQAELGLPDDTAGLVDRVRTFASHNKGGIPLTKAQTLKREAQDLAQTAYRAQDRGATINQMETLTNEAMARGLRQEIERLVPDVGTVNARTQGLMGLEKAAEHASGTGHILSRLGGTGVAAAIGSAGGAIPAIAAGGAGMMLTTPGGLTALGTGLRRMAPAAGHLTEAARAAILASLLGGEDQP